MTAQVIIFDLDDTLLNTSELLIPIASQPAFFDRIQKPLPYIEGAEENLKLLSSKYKLSLVTQGDPKIQQQKIKSLGCQQYFRQIYMINTMLGETKSTAFQRLTQDFSVSPSQILSIGNRRSTDLRPVKAMGGQTCLFHYGEHKTEVPECAEDIPDFVFYKHQELVSICRL